LIIIKVKDRFDDDMFSAVNKDKTLANSVHKSILPQALTGCGRLGYEFTETAAALTSETGKAQKLQLLHKSI
jgi:hypothetical protein